MSYGFSSQNGSGFTQIDTDLSNLAVYAHGTTTNGTILPIPAALDISKDVLIFARPTTNVNGNFLYGFIDRDNFRFRVFSSRGTQTSAGFWWDNFVAVGSGLTLDPGPNIEYLVCSTSSALPPPSSSAYGLEIRNASNQLVFHSDLNTTTITHQLSFVVEETLNLDTSLLTVPNVSNITSTFVLINPTYPFRTVGVGPGQVRLRFTPTIEFDYSSSTISVATRNGITGPSGSGNTNIHATGHRTILIGNHAP